MGSRGNYKSTYTRAASSKKRNDSLRSMIQNSRHARNQNLRATRPGYGSTPRTVGALPSGEMKYFDCERNITSLTAATTSWPAGTMFDPTSTINLGAAAVAAPLCLFAPTVGSALNQRIGRKVQILKIRVVGTLSTIAQTGQPAADPGAKIRVILVMDKQTNATQFTPSQLFTPTSTADNSLHAFQNPNDFGRFQVLKDKTIVLANPSVAGATPAIDQMGLKTQFKFNIVFKTPLQVNFNATNGGTVADIIDNSLHIMCASDTIALAPQLAYYTRVCYKE